nr:MAG TPA: hypothetical protein [Caudoviricetes sp.]
MLGFFDRKLLQDRKLWCIISQNSQTKGKENVTTTY